jgi:hypothetical protein
MLRFEAVEAFLREGDAARSDTKSESSVAAGCEGRDGIALEIGVAFGAKKLEIDCCFLDCVEIGSCELFAGAMMSYHGVD